jgi:type III secretion protein N (ATPase)
MNEPVTDETRSILDGHIILSRKLASANHYPAIDILQSKSRVMDKVTSEEHRAMAGRINAWMAAYDEVELLVKIGEYKRGSDPRSDEAIDKIGAIRDFLRQRTDEFDDFNAVLAKMREFAA